MIPAVRDLVVANRILAHEGVVDAYGHVSVRHPGAAGRFLLSRSRSPALVEAADIMEFEQDGTVVGDDPRPPYVERFIHGSIYRARPDVMAVAHSHAAEVLPYTVSSVPLRPVIHSAGVAGAHLPLWDIRKRFGDTNLLVSSAAQGDDLAGHLGGNAVVLMRGHGFAAAARSLIEVVRICIYLRINAVVLSEAARLGEVIALSPGEIEKITNIDPGAPELARAWQYWAARAGCPRSDDDP
jgi:HCOMODA/2-hydroxy-3-carboxy-muconic semialdehyde decarboxylase